MAREAVTVVLIIDTEDGGVEDLLQSIVENSNYIRGFDILDSRELDEEDDEE